MTAYPTKPITIKPEAMALLEPRWSDISPPAGTELCQCSWCGKMIGRDEFDPAWEDHIEYCAGCELCEIAVRMYDVHHTKAGQTLELRFHNKCLQEIIQPSSELSA